MQSWADSSEQRSITIERMSRVNRQTTYSILARRQYPIVGGLLLLTLLMLILSPAEEQIRDSLAWAGLVEGNVAITGLFNPHHLIYIPVNRIIFQALSPIYDGFSGIHAGRLHSAFWIMVMVVAFYSIVRHLSGSSFLGVLASMLLASSQGVWVYALQPQAYAPALGSMTLLTALIVRWSVHHLNPTRIAILVVMLTVCILYHQALVIISLPLAISFSIAQGRKGLSAVIRVLLYSGVLVLILYITAFLLSQKEWTIERFIAYLLTYGSMPDPSYFSFSNFSMRGMDRFVGSLLDAFFIPPWNLRSMVKYAFVLLISTIILWNIYKIVEGNNNRYIRLYALILVTGIWLLCLWGNPLDDAWPMLSLMPFMLLSMLAVYDVLSINNNAAAINYIVLGILSIVLVGISVRNYSERILPMHLSKGEDYATASIMQEIVPENCITFDPRQSVTQKLNYYYGNSNRDIWDIISYFYYTPGGKLPFTWENFKYDDIDCYVIMTTYISTSFTVSGVDGYMNPEGWWHYLSWLLGIEIRDGVKYIKVRKKDLVYDANGNSYYIVHRGMTEYTTLDKLFRSFDEALSFNQENNKEPFMYWLRQNMPEFGKYGS